MAVTNMDVKKTGHVVPHGGHFESVNYVNYLVAAYMPRVQIANLQIVYIQFSHCLHSSQRYSGFLYINTRGWGGAVSSNKLWQEVLQGVHSSLNSLHLYAPLACCKQFTSLH